MTASDLMTRLMVTVTPDDTVEQAARLMYHLRVKRLPVVDPGGHLVGIVSRTDVLAVYDRPDEQIEAEITDEVIQRELLIDPAPFAVTVADGVVTVAGAPKRLGWAARSWRTSGTSSAWWMYTTSSPTPPSERPEHPARRGGTSMFLNHAHGPVVTVPSGPPASG